MNLPSYNIEPKHGNKFLHVLYVGVVFAFYRFESWLQIALQFTTC
jgi:hypothetical protein